MKKYILLLIFFTYQILIFSQKFVNDFPNSNVEFSTNISLAAKLKIDRSYPIQESDVSSNISPSFQGNLNYYRYINDNYFYYIGALVGVHSFNLKIRNFDSFNNIGWGEFRGRYLEYEFPYFGSKIGINRKIKVSNNSFFSLEFSLNLIYFLKNDFTFSAFVVSTQGPVKKLFTTNFEINDSNKLSIIPQCQLNYFRKINQSFTFKSSLVKLYSNLEVFDGKYSFYGDSEILVGSISKKLRHFGIEFGILYHINKE